MVRERIKGERGSYASSLKAFRIPVGGVTLVSTCAPSYCWKLPVGGRAIRDISASCSLAASAIRAYEKREEPPIPPPLLLPRHKHSSRGWGWGWGRGGILHTFKYSEASLSRAASTSLSSLSSPMAPQMFMRWSISGLRGGAGGNCELWGGKLNVSARMFLLGLKLPEITYRVSISLVVEL